MDSILAENARWQKFFSIHEIDPVMVVYEELVAEADRVCRKLCRAVGVEADSDFDLANSNIRKLETDINKEWIEQYKASRRFF